MLGAFCEIQGLILVEFKINNLDQSLTVFAETSPCNTSNQCEPFSIITVAINKIIRISFQPQEFWFGAIFFCYVLFYSVCLCFRISIIMSLMIIAARIITAIILIGLIFLCRNRVRKMAHVSMYSYRIVSLLGLMIFLGGCLILVLLRIFENIHYYQLVSQDFLFNLFGGITSSLRP